MLDTTPREAAAAAAKIAQQAATRQEIADWNVARVRLLKAQKEKMRAEEERGAGGASSWGLPSEHALGPQRPSGPVGRGGGVVGNAGRALSGLSQ